MNEAQLTQILHTIAAKEIDDMDRLEAIRRRMLAQQAAKTRQRTRLTIAVALILLLIGATVAYAVYQIASDPGLESVQKAGLVTELNLSQTDSGLTAELTKGYADANRIALWYAIKGDALADADMRRVFVDARLLHADSAEWFGTGAQAGYPDPEAQPPGLAGILTFDHTEATPPDGLFSLKLELQVEQMPEISDGGSSQNGGGGDDMTLASDNTILATFAFEFQLPVIEALELQPQQGVTTNGVEMTLQSLRIAPSQTRVSMCFDMPSAEDWQPDPSLMIDDQAGQLVSMGTQNAKKGFTLDSLQRCMTIDFVVPYNERSKQLTFEVAQLKTSAPEPTPALLDQATKRLAEQGIVVEFHLGDHGMGWDVISAPKGLSDEEVGMMIWDSMSEIYAGPWRFEVDLP